MSEQKQADNTIDLRNGQRQWEGEHRVVLVSRDLPMNAELLIDGKGIQNAKRIEIDVDCDRAQALVKLTHLDVSCEDELQQRKQYIEMLTANLLNITLEEARVVDVILNKARQEASSNSMAVQLFAITSDDENGELTTQVLGNVLRDAGRYRALRDDVIEHGYIDDSWGGSNDPANGTDFDEHVDKLREAHRKKTQAQPMNVSNDDEIGSCEADARDAARYRALADAIGDERIRVDEYERGAVDSVSRVIGSLGLEVLSEQLVAEQAAELRAQKERAQ